MKPSARMYQCARCHSQVVICRQCDRGNVYCAGGCADNARAASQRRASKRYRSSRRGRHANAERQRRFRQRGQEKVTHQGSSGMKRGVLLSFALNKPAVRYEQPRYGVETAIHSHFCQRECSPFLRRDFLRPPERGRQRPSR